MAAKDLILKKAQNPIVMICIPQLIICFLSKSPADLSGETFKPRQRQGARNNSSVPQSIQSDNNDSDKSKILNNRRVSRRFEPIKPLFNNQIQQQNEVPHIQLFTQGSKEPTYKPTTVSSPPINKHPPIIKKPPVFLLQKHIQKIIEPQLIQKEEKRISIEKKSSSDRKSEKKETERKSERTNLSPVETKPDSLLKTRYMMTEFKTENKTEQKSDHQTEEQESPNKVSEAKANSPAFKSQSVPPVVRVEKVKKKNEESYNAENELKKQRQKHIETFFRNPVKPPEKKKMKRFFLRSPYKDAKQEFIMKLLNLSSTLPLECKFLQYLFKKCLRIRKLNQMLFQQLKIRRVQKKRKSKLNSYNIVRKIALLSIDRNEVDQNLNSSLPNFSDQLKTATLFNIRKQSSLEQSPNQKYETDQGFKSKKKRRYKRRKLRKIMLSDDNAEQIKDDPKQTIEYINQIDQEEIEEERKSKQSDHKARDLVPSNENQQVLENINQDFNTQQQITMIQE